MDAQNTTMDSQLPPVQETAEAPIHLHDDSQHAVSDPIEAYHDSAGQDPGFQGPMPAENREQPPVIVRSPPDIPFWPTLKLYLSHPNPRTAPPKPCCTLCTRRLAIPFLPPHHQVYDNHNHSHYHPTPLNPNSEEEEEKGEFEPTVILPCGHLFGATCFAGLAASYHARSLHPHCPVCNLLLTHTNPSLCPHTLAPFILPLHPIRGGCVPAVPLTIPEGGHMPAACPPCRIGHAWRNLAMAERMLFDAEAGFGVGMAEMWWDGVTRTDHLALLASRGAILRALHEAFGTAICAAHVEETVRPTWGGFWPEF